MRCCSLLMAIDHLQKDWTVLIGPLYLEVNQYRHPMGLVFGVGKHQSKFPHTTYTESFLFSKERSLLETVHVALAVEMLE